MELMKQKMYIIKHEICHIFNYRDTVSEDRIDKSIEIAIAFYALKANFRYCSIFIQLNMLFKNNN